MQAAKAALKHDSWKHLPGTDRGILMANLANLIEEHKELLATIDAWDNGKHSYICTLPKNLKIRDGYVRIVADLPQENHTV